MVKVKTKVKSKKKPLPKLFGKEITKPGFFYAGGALHYLNKDGRMVHDSKIRTQAELNKLVMTQTEFNKRYGFGPKSKKI